MKRFFRIMSLAALGALLWTGAGTGAPAKAEGAAAQAGVQIKQFRYLDKELDRISLHTTEKPDGTRDGHLGVLLDAGEGTVIRSITMKTADASGKDTNHGIWKTWKSGSGDIGHLLAVVQDGKILNTTFQETLGKFKGVTQLELYASDNNGMKPGEYYYLELITDQGTVRSDVTPFAENDISYAPVAIREFRWLDLDSDRTGSAAFESDGRKDGRFQLKLSFAQPTEVLAVILRPTDKDGKEAYQGIWRTNRAGTGWLLGITQGETVITPEFKKDVKEPVGTFRGNVAFELYASNNGTIKNGQHYVVEVETSFGTVVSKPVPFGEPGARYVNKKAFAFKTISMKLDSAAAAVDEREVTLEAAPFTMVGRSMVPIRFIGEALGAKVGWDGEERRVTIGKDGIEIVLTIDRQEAYVNGKPHILDAPAVIRDSITFVPVRFVSESMKMKVFFDDGEIYITDAMERK